MMTDHFSKERYGRPDWICGRAQAWVVTISLLYTLLAVLVIAGAIPYGLPFMIPAAVVVCFCLWHIHRVHSPVVMVCADRLLVFAPGQRRQGGGRITSFFTPVYFVIDYQRISGFSDEWNEIYLGMRETGGLVSLRVPLMFLSKADKAQLCDWIEKKKQKSPR